MVLRRNSTITAKSKSTSRIKNTSSTKDLDLYSLIQKRAYELYEKRGATHGNDWADWFEAERQVKRELGIR